MKASIVFKLTFYKNHTGSFVENKYSQGENLSHWNYVAVQVRGYGGFNKGSLIRDSEEKSYHSNGRYTKVNIDQCWLNENEVKVNDDIWCLSIYTWENATSQNKGENMSKNS